MKKYKIGIHGCDDSTYVEMELSDEQFKIISLLCEKCTDNSTYGCMPTMQIDALEKEGVENV